MRGLVRIVKGNPPRPTRFHDIRGRRLDTASWRNAPIALADEALHLVGLRRAVPWLSYRAANDLRLLLLPDWRVLEFGSGMSTVWFAKRVKFVFSVESSPEWHRRVQATLDRMGLINFQLELRSPDCAQYANLDGLEDHSFDLALVDGDCRDECVSASLLKIKRGGYVYLDNTDQPGDRQVAEARLLATRSEWTRYYNDFAPGVVSNTQGLLVRLSTD